MVELTGTNDVKSLEEGVGRPSFMSRNKKAIIVAVAAVVLLAIAAGTAAGVVSSKVGSWPLRTKHALTSAAMRPYIAR